MRSQPMIGVIIAVNPQPICSVGGSHALGALPDARVAWRSLSWRARVISPNA